MFDMRRVRFISILLVLGSLFVRSPDARAEERDYPDLRAIAATDTTPSNIWVTQALIVDILEEVESRLPTRPSRIVLRPTKIHEAMALFREMAAIRFEALGHELYLDDTNVVKAGTKVAELSEDTDLILPFSIESLKLSYPASGRRFGLWRQWIDREVELVILVGLVDARTGRMIMDKRLVRRYTDRIPAARFADINSEAYTFTHSDVAPTGFRGILENLVVVGSLAGLVAVYFANSGS